ncbi:peptidyl-prolyl cis-trans isomerase B (cyclophilin B) [Allocatelliglobosispora scoriae]|uniref:Peptidyl-prolyl cis-trans isomerase n=1 Tax=Allocatelliglobosispora scoriae TaxID=643052 RepID=A0A841BZ54_9ACTN|nr:peptidylprolyl isomerase [Allocatelliglobosispora scoriae]MBB5873414.1 peptidyl-prolyl cis-trans isomerase B (cyclophilin B) [Allocatelliglobosispora scoriae]
MGRHLSRVAVAGIAAGLLVAAVGLPAAAAAAGKPPKPPKVTHGPCQYTETPDDPGVRRVPLPPDPHRTPTRTRETVLKTSHGDITLTLTGAQAPCTVQSFLHLVQHRFYDRTICHRLTAYPTLKVLQCGDPSGTGEGGPGYRYKDELPTTLPPVPDRPDRVYYPRGTLAMANAGPDTNGSQFFLVTADSILRPNYTVFGQIDAAGLAVLDTIAAGGIQPTPEDPAPIDGTPVLTADIIRARITC